MHGEGNGGSMLEKNATCQECGALSIRIGSYDNVIHRQTMCWVCKKDTTHIILPIITSMLK